MGFIEMINGLVGKEVTAEDVASIVSDAEAFKSENNAKYETQRVQLENELKTEKQSVTNLQNSIEEMKKKGNEANSTELTRELELRIKELESELTTSKTSYTELQDQYTAKENEIKFGEARDKASTLLEGYGIKHKGMIKEAANGLYKNGEGEWYWKNESGDKIIPAKERIDYLTSSEDHLKPYVVAKGVEKGGTGHQATGSANAGESKEKRGSLKDCVADLGFQ